MQSSSTPGKRRPSGVILRSLFLALLLLLVLWGRVFYGSMEDYRTGSTLLKENQTVRAITYFDRALHWYAPLNPYVERSAQRLWEIGESAEREKDTRLALIAYESIRNGFYGVNHLLLPGKDWIGRAEKKIFDLSYSEGRGGVLPPRKDPHPSAGWSMLVVLSFLGWVGSLLGFSFFVFGRNRDSRSRLAYALAWGGSTACFLGLWILGMAKA